MLATSAIQTSSTHTHSSWLAQGCLQPVRHYDEQCRFVCYDYQNCASSAKQIKIEVQSNSLHKHTTTALWAFLRWYPHASYADACTHSAADTCSWAGTFVVEPLLEERTMAHLYKKDPRHVCHKVACNNEMNSRPSSGPNPKPHP